jgi:hypothetical protein
MLPSQALGEEKPLKVERGESSGQANRHSAATHIPRHSRSGERTLALSEPGFDLTTPFASASSHCDGARQPPSADAGSSTLTHMRRLPKTFRDHAFV